MKVFKTVLIIVGTLLSLVVAALLLAGYFKEKPGGIYVDSDPGSSVYIGNSFVGKTPYQGSFPAGQIFLKLVPEEADKNLVAYETKITLVSGIQTVVRREFGATEEESSGDVISFDRVGGAETSLIVISTPDNAQVSIDGTPQGFSPYRTSQISPAQHQITVKAPGFIDRIMTVKTVTGFRLTVFAKLAKGGQKVEVPTPAPVQKTFVEILATPTGFLRVRTEPGAAGREIAQVRPGSSYLFLDEDVATGWMEIQYEAPQPGLPNGITGWVSGQFVKKVTKTVESTPSATLK